MVRLRPRGKEWCRLHLSSLPATEERCYFSGISFDHLVGTVPNLEPGLEPDPDSALESTLAVNAPGPLGEAAAEAGAIERTLTFVRCVEARGLRDHQDGLGATLGPLGRRMP